MRFITLTLFLALLASLPGTAQPTTSDEALERVAKRSGAALLIRHNKTRKALVNMSRDRVLESYFSSEDPAHKNLHLAVLGSRARAMAKKLEAQTLTVLNAQGDSIVKVVQDVILDADKAGRLESPVAWNASVDGKHNLPASPIYLSEQLDRWVIAHAQTLTAENGQDGMLHVEFDLQSLQKSISRKSRPKRVELMAVTQDGWVVFDSRKEIPTRRSSTSNDPADYFDQFEMAGMNIHALVRAKASGQALYAGDGTKREIAVSKSGNWYLVAIGTRIRLGVISE